MRKLRIPSATPASVSSILAVTGGLAFAGAVAGAVVMLAVLALFAALLWAAGEHRLDLLDPFLLETAGVVGAVVGGFVAPVVAWTLLRRVPLGRAILEPTVGTGVGTGIGIVLAILVPFFDSALFVPIVGGALGGLAVAVVRLRRAYRMPNAWPKGS